MPVSPWINEDVMVQRCIFTPETLAILSKLEQINLGGFDEMGQ